MKYYDLIYDFEQSEEYFFCNHKDTDSVDRYAVCKGRTVEQWDKDFTFYYEPEEYGDIITDYADNIFIWLIVSERFRKLTDHLIARDVQYLPVNIERAGTGERLGGYCVANVINTITGAVDMERSDYSVYKYGDNQEYINFRKYGVFEEKLQGSHIFKLSESRYETFVSEEIKKIIEDNHLTGFAFTPVKVR